MRVVCDIMKCSRSVVDPKVQVLRRAEMFGESAAAVIPDFLLAMSAGGAVDVLLVGQGGLAPSPGMCSWLPCFNGDTRYTQGCSDQGRNL